jgi:hypothetical protein
MFKNIIAPMQAWLLFQGRCVGCGKNLEHKKGKDLQLVTCTCGRIYMYDTGAKTFRRASLDEVK